MKEDREEGEGTPYERFSVPRTKELHSPPHFCALIVRLSTFHSSIRGGNFVLCKASWESEGRVTVACGSGNKNKMDEGKTDVIVFAGGSRRVSGTTRRL